MNVKKFLRSANRGVIVGLVLVIILTIYIIVDNFIFQNEKLDIKVVVSDYIQDYSALLKDSDEVIKTGVWTKELANKEKQEYIDLANKYFTDQFYKDTGVDYVDYTNLENVSTYLDSAYDMDSLTGKGTITDCSFSTDHYSINKYGPNGAIVSFEYEAYITTTGIPNIVGPNLQSTYEIGEYDENGTEVSHKGTYSYKIHQNISIQLLRENGAWKLSKAAVEDTTYSSSEVEVKK